jgi:MoxR-like ATPase
MTRPVDQQEASLADPSGQQLSDAAAERFAVRVSEVRSNIATVIKGKPEVIDLALVCFFAEGHLLVEDVPGVGKTQLARALAASIDATWHRIQFTPDLLPSDVTGVTIYHQAAAAFEFHPGPVFGNLVLADEINRASPRTQSSLLEVMEERQVTVDGVTHHVPRPFMVIGTQNPIDMDGTYPLPEAQLDRFLMRISIGYPDLQSELEILFGQNRSTPQDRVRPVLSLADAASMVAAVNAVHVAPEVCEYLVRIVAATRTMPEVRLPVSPRGSVGLLHAAKSRALTLGRPFVTPDDIRVLVPPVLAHRLVLTPDAALAGMQAETVLEQAISRTTVPHHGNDRGGDEQRSRAHSGHDHRVGG